jgi:hypothetical protein
LVVVAEVAQVGEVAAMQGEEDNPKNNPENPMRKKSYISTARKTSILPAVFSLVLAVASLGKIEATETAAQESFDSPEQAAASLIEAASTYDVPALARILGPDSKDIITTEDPVADKKRALRFAKRAKEKESVQIDPTNPSRATLSIGKDDFPIPIPLVKQKKKWSFDTKAGRREILLRRIGENELDAIEICRGFVEAQQEYAQEKHDGVRVNQYAQKIISTPGKKDGLAWKNEDGSWGGPVGETVAKALEQGYSSKSQPYHGYYFKVLKGQGPAAPLGKMDFLVDGAMIGGFALAAAPAQYRVTGVKTFIVNHSGVVYEKDLGPKTVEIFRKMELFNPDKTWHPTQDSW